MSNEIFVFIAFRSRQQLAAFESLLKKQGISCKLIHTPIEIGMGCGFSLKIAMKDLQSAVHASKQQPYAALIGFYSAEILNGYMVYKPISQ